MDFSDILSYPSPSNNVLQQVLSSDLFACQKYLTTCARLVNILSDREIDIRTVHYKYRIEKFLRSRSKTSRRFISTYEQRFPELTISKHQLFIYDEDGNVRIDYSHPTTVSKNTPPINKNPSLSSPIVEENLSVPNIQRESHPRTTDHTCWTIVTYVPRHSLLPSILEECNRKIPIPLPWIVKRKKNSAVDCDLRPLFHKETFECEPFDLRPLFRVERELAVECDLSPLFYSEKHLFADRDFDPPAVLNDVEYALFWNLLLPLIFIGYVVTVVCGMELSLLCYASLGVLAYIHHVVRIRF